MLALLPNPSTVCGVRALLWHIWPEHVPGESSAPLSERPSRRLAQRELSMLDATLGRRRTSECSTRWHRWNWDRLAHRPKEYLGRRGCQRSGSKRAFEFDPYPGIAALPAGTSSTGLHLVEASGFQDVDTLYHLQDQ